MKILFDQIPLDEWERVLRVNVTGPFLCSRAVLPAMRRAKWGRIAQETPGAVWANQFDNIANRRAHIEGTAPEIWEQLGGRVDGFTCAAGTGGTIAGVGLGLKAFDESNRKGAPQATPEPASAPAAAPANSYPPLESATGAAR